MGEPGRNPLNFQYKHAALRLTFIFAGLVLSGFFAGCCFAADKKPSVQGGNCQGCHGSQAQILPAGHVETKGQNMDFCRQCHQGSKSGLKGKLPLSHSHFLSGIHCAECHEKIASPEPLRTKQCFSCHISAAEVAKRTAGQNPNPHNSIHYGPDLDCDLCHHVHRQSENFCNQCHEYTFTVP